MAVNGNDQHRPPAVGKCLLTSPCRSPVQGSVSSIGCCLISLNDFACGRTRALIQKRHGPCITPHTFA